jgi:hypothetical protein
MSMNSTPREDRQRVVAAIVAGVSAYIEEEAKVRAQTARPTRPASLFNLWALSGRQEMMRMRAPWQRRMA